MKRVAIVLALTLVSAATSTAADVGFIEEFALAKDRGETLRKLIPGTEDYYYYHALHYLNTEQYEKAAALDKPWIERFGQTPRLIEMQTRHALLTYERNPERTLQYLRQRLNLRFDHQKAIADGPPNLPVAVDPGLFSRTTLRTASFARWTNLDNFEDSALDWLAGEELTAERRRNLLQRLQRPDIANLAHLVATDLGMPNAPGFGAFAIHKQMTLPQLAELLRLRPALLDQTAFVQTWIAKLHPGADEDWRRDPARLRAYLDRLLTFARRLAPVNNALKAHILYHRLVLDQRAGAYDRDLFVEYLKLPRQQPYMAKALIEAVDSRRFPADLNASFVGVTLLPIVGGDESLVRSYLKRFFLTSNSPAEFEPFIDDVYLKHLFAETKIENGLGEPEQWAAHLPPEKFRELKERIDIDFAPTNKTSFAAGEPVRLDLHIKNVSTLIVKVFEINTPNYYRTHLREIETDINLDGLVANAEHTHTYTETPFRRVGRRYEFPQLSKPGVYVIDFIGAGKSSRALVRKDRLRPLVSTSTAGQTIAVVDEANRQVADAAVWLGGREYKADAAGVVVVPFSTSPGRQPIVLTRSEGEGNFASLDHLDHQPEQYRLAAGIHVDREALLARQLATVLVRPGLYLNGAPVSIKLLEDVKLRLTATDRNGIATSTEVPDFKLFEDRETEYQFRVPARLASLTIALEANVKSLSLNQSTRYSVAETFALNGIDATDKIEDLHLARFGGDYVLELLGRTGETKADRTVQLALKHRDFREQVQMTLKTDAQGRIRLGALPEIASLTATAPTGTKHHWDLPHDRHSYRQLLHARVGELVAIPYMGTASAPARDELALFDVQGASIRADRFEALALRDGMIELRGLAAGDYDLWLKKQGQRIRIRVVDGPVVGNYVLGKIRHLETPRLKPVQIASISAKGDDIAVRLRDASPFARVHVYATRYEPAFSAFADFSKVRAAELHGTYPARADSVYLTGRNIGDELRYVLDRRYLKKYPGNMLDRPALLLNPWIVRSTETDEQAVQGGDSFEKKEAGAPAVNAPAPATPAAPPTSTGDFANLDFLAESTLVLANLLPNKEGVVSLSRKELGAHGLIHVVAVDPLSTTVRSLALHEAPAKVLDLRLRNGLDPQGHFSQQKQVSVLTAGQPFVLADAASGRFEVYDSLARVYGLYATLSKDAKLAEFAFLLNWPNLKLEEKRALHSKHACHELHFFLAKKDPAFFQTVVRPFLANKKDKTFLDRWLLEENLIAYVDPWRHGRLNTVERILLAQRLAGELARTTRHLQDLNRLLPPNTERARVLFESAVLGQALNASDELGLMNAAKNRAMLTIPALQEGLEAKPAGTTGGAAPLGGGMTSAFGSQSLPKSASTPAAPELKKLTDRMARRGAMGLGKEAKDWDKESKKESGAEALGEKAVEFGFVTDFHPEDRAKRQIAQLYRRLDPTQELAENNYHHLAIQRQLADLAPVSAFWLDYARHAGKGPFLSRHLADASRNFTEMMFALAVLDLPFSAGKHEVKFDGNRMTFTAAGAALAFHEEIRPVVPAANKLAILVSQNFYREGDRYRDENGERFEKLVSDEFVVQTVYGCQVVVTNATSARQRLDVLIQIPVGSIALAGGQATRSLQLDLEPYRTQTIDYHFYFPRSGQFAGFPVHVAKNEALVASGQPATFSVVDKPTKLDTESWDYVSQNGTSEQVLALLNRENVNALNLDKIAFRMRDKEFFTAVLQLLRDRHVYNSTLWSYGLFHNALAAAREYLLHADGIVAECAGPIVSPLLTVAPIDRGLYEHLEYRPLVNARAHALGQRRQIVNARVHEQYHRFLKVLSYQRQRSDDELLAITHYLLLQDRIEEALGTFAQVNVERIATRLQYDYCSAYLDLFTEEPQKARAIANKYVDYPVTRWRDLFLALSRQLDEIEGKNPLAADGDDRTQRQTQLASRDPGFEFVLAGPTLDLRWQNLDKVRINYYLMDVELLFSRNPFVQQDGGQFASIRPNLTQDVNLPAGDKKLDLRIPAELLRKNVLVEVAAAGKTRSLPYYANAMDVRLTENYGQLRVTEAASGKPLPKVYIKTYVRLGDGQVKFHKDGYTDQRGRFDYATVSTPDTAGAARFALLVLSEEHGAQIREAAPPQQ